MIKVSAGSASVLGLKKIQTDAECTTVYLLNGDRCTNNCGFCPQARESKANLKFLSRVIWPSFEDDEVIESIVNSYNKKQIKRVCIQSTSTADSFERCSKLIEIISAKCNVPISAAVNANTLERVGELIQKGADKVCMAIDACNENIYKQIKGGNYESKINLLKQCAEKFPNRISTHLIVGLGETEEEIIKIIDSMHRFNISVGLFAFNPVRGTKLEKCTSPNISTYRRIQIVNYLLKNKFVKFQNLKFEKNKLVKIDVDKQNILDKLMDGKAFETPGCPGCNRPYYTEKPGGIMYNYPKKLTSQQINMAIKESELQII